MYDIVTTPNKVLIEVAKPVEKFDKKLQNIIKGMSQSLLATVDPIGVGLAAPQVGISSRIFLMKPTEKSAISVFINPVIESVSGEMEIPSYTNSKKVEKRKPKESKNHLLEGCLSIPNIWGNVTRNKSLTLSWQDEKGEHHTDSFEDFQAIIVQHEVDHLNGVLFSKHVMDQGNKLYRSEKDASGEDVFEEVKLS